MEIIIYIIPFLTAIFLLIAFSRKIVWWEYIVMIVAPIVVSLIVRLIMVSYNNTDTEYLGDYITKVRHYDEWDEWVHRTCTRTVTNGKTTTTQAYDCSYRQHHPERWAYFDQDGEEHWLFFEEEFDEIVRKFGTKMVFVDMHRRYYRIDGDAQDYYWNGSEETAWPVTHSHKYTNKLQNSRSIFNFEEIDEEFLIRVYQRYHHLPWKILETKRTIVRELTLSDMDALFELYAQPGVTEYTEGLYERQEEEEYERAYINHMYRYFGYGMWLVFSKETGELIGRAGFEHHNLVIGGKEELALEMGYVISPKVQRQGYAYEVCQALLEYAKRNIKTLSHTFAFRLWQANNGKRRYFSSCR